MEYSTSTELLLNFSEISSWPICFDWLIIGSAKLNTATELEAKVLCDSCHPSGHIWDPGSKGYAGQIKNNSVSMLLSIYGLQRYSYNTL